MRRRAFVWAVFALMAFVAAQAQQKMKLTLQDGSTIEKLVKDVASITFEEVEALGITDNGVSKVTHGSAHVDLSLSGYFDGATEVGIVYSTSEDEVAAGSGTKVLGNNAAANMFFDLTDLEPLTTYYYVLYAENKGYQKIMTEINSFTTLEKRLSADFIDLGLSVKWASWNVGATSVADVGKLYVWGDPTGELTLSSSAINNLYDAPSNIAGTEYDIATRQWGKDWRMPTKAEMAELANLDITRVDDYEGSGIGGFMFEAKNGNKMFMPSSGYETKNNKFGNYAYTYYWTAEKSNSTTNVYYANIQYGVNIAETGYKVAMMAIRPVYIGEDPSEHDGETETGRQVKRVNLGLNVDWADRNVGADSETAVGNYYAWGETAVKSDYKLATYEWVIPDWVDPTQAYMNIGNEIGGTQYDVVLKEWGGKWRMPTDEEIQQLIDKCQWTWTIKNGIGGYEITRSGYSGTLFLPAGGLMNGTVNKGAGSELYYWTSKLHGMRTDIALDLEYRNGSPLVSHYSRHNGLLIRPVRVK